MKGMRATQLIAAVVVLAAASLSAASKAAPDIAVSDARGMTVRLTDLKGKVVLVDFWASWCVPCKTSVPALDSLYREFGSRGLQVLPVNVDEKRANADAFLAGHPVTMPVFFDPKGASADAFRVQGMPSSFLVDRDGAIRFTHMGYTSAIEASYRQEIAQLLSEHTTR